MEKQEDIEKKDTDKQVEKKEEEKEDKQLEELRDQMDRIKMISELSTE